jgi:hypothetical protein
MKKMKNRRGTRLFLNGWSKSLASIALSYLVASPTLKAQDQTPPPVTGGSTPGPADAANGALPSVPADQTQPTLPPPTLQTIKPKKNEVAVSGDFMYGQGTLTLPVGYSLDKSLTGIKALPPVGVAKPTRSSSYFGGTASYSYGQAWYIDFSYSEGNSSGNQNFSLGSLGNSDNNFTLNDNWYQGYIRYAFPQLRGKRLSAYLRAGVTYIDATLTDSSTVPGTGFYHQNDSSTEIRGNLGAGVTYSLYSTRKFRLGLQLEGEGYYGNRSQDSTETLQRDSLPPTSATINNDLYGGVGRALVHFEYRFGHTGLFRAFVDGGGEVDYTEINYPSAGTFNELLWGPYVKIGFRYSF